MYWTLMALGLSATDVEDEILQGEQWQDVPKTWTFEKKLEKYAGDNEQWRSSMGISKGLNWEWGALNLDLTPGADFVLYGVEERVWTVEPYLGLGLSMERFRLSIGAWDSYDFDAGEHLYGDYASLMWKPRPWDGGLFVLGPRASYQSGDTVGQYSLFLGFEQDWQWGLFNHGPILNTEGLLQSTSTTMGKGKNKSSLASLNLQGSAMYRIGFENQAGWFSTDFYLGYTQGLSPVSKMRQRTSSEEGYTLEWNSSIYW